jgi:SAM-dependent methyltransferase
MSMIDLSAVNEWQSIDPSTGLVFPWYTKSFLDELVTWDLKDKVVFEYGCGASSLWWAAKCKKLYGVENNKEYFGTVAYHIGDIARISHEMEEERYINSIRQWGIQFDIVIVDGGWRDESIPTVLEHLKPGGKIIYDNWMQPSVCCQTEEVQRTLLAFPHGIFKQEGHPDWQTAYFTKPVTNEDLNTAHLEIQDVLNNG